MWYNPYSYNFQQNAITVLPKEECFHILSWTSTVHRMHSRLCSNISRFEEDQAYVVLSRVKSMDGLRIEDLDCSKLTGKKPCNITALAETDRMRNI
ncbi:hypothetical protein AVEN_115416-1 [Araneus ventricosus]|uniref:Uncharacterized protein n=1 Tax=Araneus ventricosus TaxID=182803 RepID=A0A4Y1ZZL1_ARAVE|nr:hypothetical protein AVEN_115416-1 [Araneus ventricosus]